MPSTRNLVAIIREMKLIETANLPPSIKNHALAKLRKEAELTGGEISDQVDEGQLRIDEQGGKPPTPQAPMKGAKATP